MAAVNKNVFSFRLKTTVFVLVLRSIRSWFHVRGPATKKARSSSLSLVDCLTRSLLLAERLEARPRA